MMAGDVGAKHGNQADRDSHIMTVQRDTEHFPSSESGQSLVLIALVFVILLAFVGVAVDAGFAFVRSSGFSRAVDSATLAGVVDLNPTSTDTAAADLRAAQFLAANGWPTSTLTLFQSARSFTDQGIPQYTITATWPVDTFFLRLVGIREFPVTHSATGAFFAQSEIFTPTEVDRGQIRKATQFIFGKDGCSTHGDPVSPLQATAGVPNTEHPLYGGRYLYRITVPLGYEDIANTSLLKVELFDPDSTNPDSQDGQQFVITHSSAVGGGTETRACVSGGRGDDCVIDTGEDVTASFQNPFWFARVDENWTGACVQDNSTGITDAVTTYELYYQDETGQRQSLAMYTDDNSQLALTDLRWVSPGVSGNPVADSGSFEIDLGTSGVPVRADGSRFIYLEVISEGGSAKNGFDLRAGPPASYYTGIGLAALDPEVNARNLQLAEDSVGYGTLGVTVLALGRMPLNNYVSSEPVTFLLQPLSVNLAEQTVYAKLFDYDPGSLPATPHFNFRIDSVQAGFFDVYANIVDPATEGHAGAAADPLQVTCDAGTNCDNSWTDPQIRLAIPSTTSFGGGRLEVTYEPRGDAHTWSVGASAGDPYLTR
jgi:hypothetical protein